MISNPDTMRKYEHQPQDDELVFVQDPHFQEHIIDARTLRSRSQRSFSNSSLQEANGRNMSKYIIKEFFSLLTENQYACLEHQHRERLREIEKDARDIGNTKHLKMLFEKRQDEREEKWNNWNRLMAQEKIAKNILKEIMTNNSIKDPVNYICTCYCYMYRLNYPETAESGVALVRKPKVKKQKKNEMKE